VRPLHSVAGRARAARPRWGTDRPRTPQNLPPPTSTVRRAHSFHRRPFAPKSMGPFAPIWAVNPEAGGRNRTRVPRLVRLGPGRALTSSPDSRRVRSAFDTRWRPPRGGTPAPSSADRRLLPHAVILPCRRPSGSNVPARRDRSIRRRPGSAKSPASRSRRSDAGSASVDAAELAGRPRTLKSSPLRPASPWVQTSSGTHPALARTTSLRGAGIIPARASIGSGSRRTLGTIRPRCWIRRRRAPHLRGRTARTRPPPHGEEPRDAATRAPSPEPAPDLWHVRSGPPRRQRARSRSACSRLIRTTWPLTSTLTTPLPTVPP